jgi:hypothetical protein
MFGFVRRGLLGGIGRIRFLEAASIGMVTIDAHPKTYPILTTIEVLDEAIGEGERLPQIPGPTIFRIGKTRLVAEGIVGHGESAFSNARRSGW